MLLCLNSSAARVLFPGAITQGQSRNSNLVGRAVSQAVLSGCAPAQFQGLPSARQGLASKSALGKGRRGCSRAELLRSLCAEILLMAACRARSALPVRRKSPTSLHPRCFEVSLSNLFCFFVPSRYARTVQAALTDRSRASP